MASAKPPRTRSNHDRPVGGSGAVRDWLERVSANVSGYHDLFRLGILASGLLVILFYAFSAGGYYVVRRSYGELAIFLLVIAGLAFGLTRPGRMSGPGRLELGLFGAFSLWILISVEWSYIPARSLEEFVRALLYLGGFAMFYLYFRRREWLSWIGNAFLVIAVIVALDAILGKVLPDVISHPDPFQTNRLSFPLTYWNTLGLFMAMAFPLALRAVSDRATGLLWRCLYAASMFLFTVVLFYTFSRAGIIMLAAAAGIYLAAAVYRLRAVLQALVVVFWTAAAVFASYIWLPAMLARAPGQDELVRQGHWFGLVLLLLLAGVAGTQVVTRAVEQRVEVSPAQGRKLAYGLAIAGAVASLTMVVAFLPSLKAQLASLGSPQQANSSSAGERLLNVQSARYEEYAVSLRTFAEHPLTGTGAATWVVGWLQNRSEDISINNGHSLLFGTFSDLGIVGVILLLSFIAVFVCRSVKDIRFLGRSRHREVYGAIFSACAVLLIHSMIDWDWRMPVAFLAFFMFAGALLRFGGLSREAVVAGGEAQPAVDGAADRTWNLPGWLGWKWLVGAGCAVALLFTLFPMISSMEVDNAYAIAQEATSLGNQNGNQAAAVKYAQLEQVANRAHQMNPLDGEPLQQMAQASMGLGRPQDAENYMLQALQLEPYNDQFERNLARIYMETNQVDKAVAALKKSREINPLESRETGLLEQQVRKMGGHI